MKVSLSLGMALLLAGCASKPPKIIVEPRAAGYNEQEYQPYKEAGTSSIVGQAFLKTRGGDVKYGAGNEIRLTPRTSYSSEWWTREVLDDHVLGNADQRAEAFNRYTVADGEGRFRFDSLPAGEYFLVTEVVWEVPSTKGPYQLEKTGGLVGKGISLNPGQFVQVILPLARSIERIPIEPSDSAKKNQRKPRRRGQP